MSKKSKQSSLMNFFKSIDPSTQLTLWILFIFSFSIISYLSLFEMAGLAGGYLSSFMHMLLGQAAFLIPTALLFVSISLYKLQRNQDLEDNLNYRLFFGMLFLIISLTGFLSWLKKVPSLYDLSLVMDAGGVVGYSIYPIALGDFLGRAGSLTFLVSTFLIGFLLISRLTLVELFLILKTFFTAPKRIFSVVKNSQKDGEKPTKNERKNSFVTPEEKVPEPESSAKKPVNTKAIRLEGKVATDADLSIKKPEKTYNWSLPPFDLLVESKYVEVEEDVEKNSQNIADTLQSFGIDVDMGDAFVGPTVTQYTLKPSIGVRLSAIDKLQKDLALALAAKSIRIQAPIPGKSLVGIEIPNANKAEVRLRDMIQTHEFFNFKGDLPVAVGKDVAGNNIIYSLAKMPHLLVAGATGAGKSVWINGMLLSLLYRYAPNELQLILVDMKRVELKLYDNIPHLLAPVITDSEKAINALKWAVIEMDNRYKLLEVVGKRNIVDFNHFALESESEDPLPYIVVVIDELADLMMLAKSEVEPMIVRLAQMSRAVGIHLVLGTQRPDTSVITGLIKGNIPTRIAFTVASGIDSRVILDSVGAEDLLGQGDALMVSPSSLYAVRFQGPFVEEKEVKACIKFLKEQAEGKDSITNNKPEITQKPKQEIHIPGMPDGYGEKQNSYAQADEIYDQAVRTSIKYQKASASFLQQIMGIGYPKAARIILQMEEDGLIGPQNGSKPREVFITEGEWNSRGSSENQDQI